jgi:hypothetical protein
MKIGGDNSNGGGNNGGDNESDRAASRESGINGVSVEMA